MNQKSLLLTVLLASFIWMAASIDLNNLFPYDTLSVPNYINKNDGAAPDNALITLGRVLFYDKKLSANNTIACASCHQQQFAFSDPAQQSVGLDGELTGRHSMRLINARFANETRFFWDERANTLEEQTTQPIQDHIEMGFSGTNGQPDFNSLIQKLESISYYNQLFEFVYGDANITEARMQEALAQFIRSIQSFDSKYDTGLALANGNLNANFPNFTTQENLGKQLYMDPPPAGGAGCQACHRAPEFDIDPNSLNNGVIAVAGDPTAIDLTNTRAPSLRDLVNPNGVPNGPFMHNGNFNTLRGVINHYNTIPNNPANTNLDPRLNPPGPGTQNLNLTQTEKDALVAFLETLTGNAVYTAEQWSNPFNTDGTLDLILVSDTEVLMDDTGITLFPNPTEGNIHLELANGDYTVQIIDASGVTHRTIPFMGDFFTIDIAQLPSGLYFLQVIDNQNNNNSVQTIIKQ